LSNLLFCISEQGFITQEEYDEEWEEGSWAVNAIKLFVGSLCYARYPNDEWYWGVVEEIGGEGQAAAFSVRLSGRLVKHVHSPNAT
jgi:hypothetical protein